MKVLAIGNRFSQDALAYLHQIAATHGSVIDCVNLFIPGCTLQRHMEAYHQQEQAYE